MEEKSTGENKYFDIGSCGFVSALWLDGVFSKKTRRFFSGLMSVFLLLGAVAVFVIFIASRSTISFAPLEFLKASFLANGVLTEKIIDFLFLALFFRAIIFSLESFYRSKSFFRGSTSETEFPRSNLGNNAADRLNFEAASLLFKTSARFGGISGLDIFRFLPKTDIGGFAFVRLGIAAGDFSKIISKYDFKTEDQASGYLQKIIEDVSSGKKNIITLAELVLAAFDSDEKIGKIFFDLKIRREGLKGALEWSENYFARINEISSWWREENLARVRGIAKDWSYGATYLLDRFSRIFAYGHPATSRRLLHFAGHQNQIEAMEAVLSRQAQANVLVVGEPGVGKRTVVAGLDDMINIGKARPELEYKVLVELLVPSLIASAKTKGELEDLIIRVFNDAVRAGNIVLLIDNFSQFINSAASLGVSLLQVLSPYFGSKNLQIIALDDSPSFKKFIEPDGSLMQFFELVRIEEPSAVELVRILEDVSLELEAKTKTIILYPTIQEVVKASDTYLTEGALPERAIDILETVSSRVSGLERNVVLPEDVSGLVSEKTKMPLGVLKPEEREKLTRLEEILHQRVVDQEEAISTIGAAVKRVRVGIQATKKPLASFLFLGPTGVGKTETAKALADVYFGNEENMTRFDMSEYQNENGLERLIGSFERSEPGIMSSKLRERPYGLLLLDEFEKCHIKVRDLFLQVLDEGFFTDAFGKKVFTRNNIIIATSNAASRLIWEMGKSGAESLPAGRQASAMKESVIDFIQKEGIFKAELLNRFDAIVVFRHLSPEHLKEIAKIMLEKLKKRLFEQNEIELIINDALAEKVAEIGYDPAFGARPMQRAIQERVEKKIAEWIISGKVARGAKIEFSTEDLEGV